LLLRQQERLDEAIWHVFAGVHARFHTHDHGAVDFHDAIVKPAAT
jgi:hypothetical protein